MMARMPDITVAIPPPGDVRGALTELGIGFYMNGNEAVCLCPFHDDRTAGNFSVNTETGMSHCFACGKGGGFWRIVEAVRKCRPDEARRWCRARVGKQALRVPELAPPRPRRVTEVDTTQIMNEASLALFTAPPERARLDRWLSAQACADLGVLWDPRKSMWIIPIRNPITGELWGWQEKAHDGRHFRNHPRNVRKSRSLFGISDAPEGPLIVVESPLDAARIHTAGVRGAVSGYGARLSADQLSLITYRATHLVLAFDNDPAGIRATRDVIGTYKSLPITVFNYDNTKCKDPGEMTKQEIHWALDHATSGLLEG